MASISRSGSFKLSKSPTKLGLKLETGLGESESYSFVGSSGGSPTPPTNPDFILKEDGFYLLYEDSGKIITEQS